VDGKTGNSRGKVGGGELASVSSRYESIDVRSEKASRLQIGDDSCDEERDV